MDVIGQSLFFAIRVVIWLAIQLFHLNCHATKAIFERLLGRAFNGALLANGFVFTAANIFLWTLVGTILLGALNGAEGAATGIVVGSIYGVATAVRVIKLWEDEALFNPPPPEEEQVKLLDTPVSLAGESKPLSPIDEAVEGNDNLPIFVPWDEEDEDLDGFFPDSPDTADDEDHDGESTSMSIR